MRWILALGALTVLLVSGCGEEPTFATLYEVSAAGVTVNGSPAKAPVKLGLKHQVVVATKGAFARISLSDGTKLFLLPDEEGGSTTFSLESYRQEGSSRAMLFRLIRGVVALIVPPNRPSGDVIEVEASYTTTAIRGTQLKIETGAKGDLISVKEGTIEVRSKQDPTKVETVKTGEQIGHEPAKGFLAKSPYNPLVPKEQAVFSDSMVPIRKVVESK